MARRMFWLGIGGVVIACGGAASRTGPDESASGGSSTAGSSGGVNPGGPAGAGSSTEEPISVCGSNTLAGGIYCSKNAFCEALECGKPWSLFDANGCARELCWSDDACANGSRCVPAPVAGKFDATCFEEYDSCEDSSGACECMPYPECGARALCLSVQEFPPESECPVESFSCAELSRTAVNLQAYADEEDFLVTSETSSAVKGRTEACRAKVNGLLASCD